MEASAITRDACQCIESVFIGTILQLRFCLDVFDEIHYEVVEHERSGNVTLTRKSKYRKYLLQPTLPQRNLTQYG